jgi:hypothetical protein
MVQKPTEATPVQTADGKRDYKMTVSLNVLKHLGLNLYSSTPAVLSETVANAWDADATKVTIDWDKEAKIITITDNGTGMDYGAVNDKFLFVGYERRENDPTKTARGRHVMGRKGIGKLSLFAIADQVDVHTVFNDGTNTDRNALRMLTPKIKTAAENEEDYGPEALDPDVTNDLEQGTRIILSKLNRSVTKSTESNLRSRLARRFSIIGAEKEFEVSVDGHEITPADLDYFKKVQYLWSIGNVGDRYAAQATQAKKKKTLPGLVDKDENWRVEGWVGTVDEVKGLDEGDNRIVLMAWGKLVQEDLLADIKEGGLFTKYLSGEIRADFLDLDDKDDIATSDRQRLKQTDPRYEKLRKWVADEILKTVGNNWRDWRNEGALDDALALPAIKEWWDNLEGTDEKAAAKKLIGRIGTVLKEKESEKRELYAHTILAFEKLRARKALAAIDQLQDGADISEYQKVFGSQDDVEMVLFHQIAAGRVAILSKFDEISPAQKEHVVRDYLFEHIWLLDPSWERPTTTKKMEQVVDKYWKDKGAKLTPEQAKGRLDIRVVTSAGEHVIIELKRGSVSVKFETLHPQLLKYQQTLKKVLQAHMNEPNPRIRVVAVVGKVPDDVDKPTQDQLLGGINASILTYDELVNDAEESYRDYLDASAKASKLAEIISRISEEIDDDPDGD